MSAGSSTNFAVTFDFDNKVVGVTQCYMRNSAGSSTNYTQLGSFIPYSYSISGNSVTVKVQNNTDYMIGLRARILNCILSVKDINNKKRFCYRISFYFQK